MDDDYDHFVDMDQQTNKRLREKFPVEFPDNSLGAHDSSKAKWDNHRRDVCDVQSLYELDPKFSYLADRLSKCSVYLRFATTTANTLSLSNAYFCHVRFCPVCQWRRSLTHTTAFAKNIMEIIYEYPKYRWIFVTLTIENCQVTSLRKTLNLMNRAYNKLINYDQLKLFSGWVRTTEVTREKNGYAHPHFHVLVIVPPSYFSGEKYVSQELLTKLWQRALGVTYSPIVHITAVKTGKEKSAIMPDGTISGNFLKAVFETFKYTVKPSDLTSSPYWLYHLTEQTKKLRFLSCGGILGKIMDDSEPLGDDWEDPGVQLDESKGLIGFEFSEMARYYQRALYLDLPFPTKQGS